MKLDELVTETRSRAASVDPLDLLATAALQQQELTAQGEELLDYWVQHARTAGCSWAQIGGSLGVSKQAVQQRHSAARGMLARLKDKVPVTGMFNRFTDRARSAIVHAQEEARTLGHDFIGTEHLLIGLLAEPECPPARVLLEAGLTRDVARGAIENLIGCGGEAPRGHIPFSARAKRALELSLTESRGLGHNHIGTEHILLGMLTEGDGVAVQVLRDAGAEPAWLRAAVLAELGT